MDESIRLRITRDGDREAFRVWVEMHPRRRWLRSRIEAIARSGITQVVLRDQDLVYERFRKSHPHLAPRHQRDISRIVALIKAHALLNCWHRENPQVGTIEANRKDVDTGFWLYGLIAKSNELGLAPQLYEIWDTVIKPLVARYETGVPRRTIIAKYHEVYGRFLSDERLRREILPALEACGLIVQEADPADRRQRLVSRPVTEGGPPTNASPISPLPLQPEIGETSGGPTGLGKPMVKGPPFPSESSNDCELTNFEHPCSPLTGKLKPGNTAVRKTSSESHRGEVLDW